MKDLNRTKVDNFKIEESIYLSDLEKLKNKDKVVIPIEKLFENKEEIILNDRKSELFLNGVKLTQKKQDDLYRIYKNSEFLGIGIVKENLLKRDVIL
ncbi:MAG: hypothetical protein HFJ25_01125 [Clostridia bacterium]|jgi:tRNA U55 pseudouridine synthase TruB|nr:hypothetical protein [Clostridia bacterium]